MRGCVMGRPQTGWLLPAEVMLRLRSDLELSRKEESWAKNTGHGNRGLLGHRYGREGRPGCWSLEKKEAEK